MSDWSIWDPGAGSIADISGLSNAFSAFSSGFGRSKSFMDMAAKTAGRMISQAVSAQIQKISGAGGELGQAQTAGQRLVGLFDAYVSSLRVIKTQTDGYHDQLGRLSSGLLEQALTGQTPWSDWWCEQLVLRVQQMVNPPTPSDPASSPVHDTIWQVVFGLTNLARQRKLLDDDFDANIRQTLNTAGTLFGVTPSLPAPPPPPAPPTLPPWMQGDGGLSSGLDDAARGIGAVGSASGIVPSVVGDVFGWSAFGAGIGVMTDGFNLISDGLEIGAVATGETNASKLGATSLLVGTGADAASLGRDIASLASKGGSSLVPGFGLGANVLGIASGVTGAVDDFENHKWGAGACDVASAVGNALSIAGDFTIPPVNLTLKVAGAVVSGLAGFFKGLFG